MEFGGKHCDARMSYPTTSFLGVSIVEDLLLVGL